MSSFSLIPDDVFLIIGEFLPLPSSKAKQGWGASNTDSVLGIRGASKAFKRSYDELCVMQCVARWCERWKLDVEAKRLHAEREVAFKRERQKKKTQRGKHEASVEPPMLTSKREAAYLSKLAAVAGQSAEATRMFLELNIVERNEVAAHCCFVPSDEEESALWMDVIDATAGVPLKTHLPPSLPPLPVNPTQYHTVRLQTLSTTISNSLPLLIATETLTLEHLPPEVTHIEDGFLREIPKELRAIHFEDDGKGAGPFGLRVIGKHFCNYDFRKYSDDRERVTSLSRLTEVTLQGLQFLYKIDDGFLVETKVRAITLRNLPSLGTVGCDFGRFCKSLVTVNISELPRLESIGSGFVQQTAVSSVMLEDLPSLEHVGGFQPSYGYIRRVVLRRLPRLRSFGSSSDLAAKTLRSVVMEGLDCLEAISEGFVRDTEELEELKLERLPSLRIIRDYALIYCSCTVVELTDLPKLEIIGDYVLQGAKRLRALKIADLPQLQSIGCSFANSCDQLEMVTFSNLPLLVRLGKRLRARDPYTRDYENSLLMDCRALRKVSLINLPKLEMLCQMSNNRNCLKSITMQDCPTLSTIERIGPPAFSQSLSGTQHFPCNFSFCATNVGCSELKIEDASRMFPNVVKALL